ncbi:phosphatidylinositol phosphate synthase [Corynebacterium sp. HS2168-gen11]|uniref:phosphatidylinositol phosphate synthase n=1 Tax=Corynebacterium sp. HS2168-gen11 TaxID=2974027 RepID=UPI00216ABA79|nr:CDP-alcohol phosphatidyltransferase family protein [Corynebacterium sp. HS2168-gen11]MCS4535206.1 CDP-alcohol phosphatidyltransferase family protein [Corynebacterium sp. HS2168-gen11]
MLSVKGRKPAAIVMEPLAKLMLRIGLTPNMVTILGATLTSAAAAILIPQGYLWQAALLCGVLSVLDMVDGTMARMLGSGSRFGATLDASCDRITDGVIFSALLWWLIYTQAAAHSVILSGFIVLVSSQVISYVKARGEASGLAMKGGLIERPERLIIGLGGIGLEGFGVDSAVVIALIILAVGSIITVVQRLWIAARDVRAAEPIAAPDGAILQMRGHKDLKA